MGARLLALLEGGAFHSPVSIHGLSEMVATNVNVRLVDSVGDVLAQRSFAAGEDISDTYLRFTVRERTPAQVEVTAGDGSFEPLVVSVLLLPGQQFIDVNAPMAGDKICGRALILGYSSTSGGKVIGAALDGSGETLAQGTGTGGERGEYAPFFVGLNPEVEAETSGFLSAYAIDAATGATLDQSLVPVTFYPTGSDACR